MFTFELKSSNSKKSYEIGFELKTKEFILKNPRTKRIIGKFIVETDTDNTDDFYLTFLPTKTINNTFTTAKVSK